MKLLKFIAVVIFILVSASMLRSNFRTTQHGKRIITGDKVSYLPKDFQLNFKLQSGASVNVRYKPSPDLSTRAETITITHMTWLWKSPSHDGKIFTEAHQMADEQLIPYDISPNIIPTHKEN